MVHRVLLALLIACLSVEAESQTQPVPSVPEGSPVRPWRSDPRFQRIAAALAATKAIDNHTHLLDRLPFLSALDTEVPVLLRSGTASHVSVLKSRFGIDWDPGRAQALDQEGKERRETLIREAGGESAYWSQHLDLAGVELALVNQEWPPTQRNDRLKWVPHATTLLYPLDSRHVEARNPGVASDVKAARKAIGQLFAAIRLAGPPPTLAAYLSFVDGQLVRWKAQGALALKFYDAYDRTLLFRDVSRARAEAVYTRGLATPLSREDYLTLQDHIARHIFLEAGALRLPVQIHTSHGGGPFLRLMESDVRLLEEVLADPRFFGTNFVLIHGGAPLIEQAAYLAGNKANVWIDISAMTFLYPTPDLAAAIRKYLTFAPERTLFSTDAGGSPTIPVGPEVHHLALVPAAREALTLALTDLVRDGVWDESTAIRVGQGVLRENARRLYGL
jgi:predicted TIM-barrel fold metal-dependent hydrolase